MAKTSKGIKPKRIDTKQLKAKVLKTMLKEAKFAQGEFNKTTSSWTGDKPTFKIEVKQDDSLTVNVFTSGNQDGIQKWIWLNYGTDPHVIKAKTAPSLVFQVNFKPKTKVKTFSSSSGGSSPPWRSALQVNHPGTEARDWTKEIVKIVNKRLPKGIVKAVEL